MYFGTPARLQSHWRPINPKTPGSAFCEECFFVMFLCYLQNTFSADTEIEQLALSVLGFTIANIFVMCLCSSYKYSYRWSHTGVYSSLSSFLRYGWIPPVNWKIMKNPNHFKDVWDAMKVKGELGAHVQGLRLHNRPFSVDIKWFLSSLKGILITWMLLIKTSTQSESRACVGLWFFYILVDPLQAESPRRPGLGGPGPCWKLNYLFCIEAWRSHLEEENVKNNITFRSGKIM